MHQDRPHRWLGSSILHDVRPYVRPLREFGWGAPRVVTGLTSLFTTAKALPPARTNATVSATTHPLYTALAPDRFEGFWRDSRLACSPRTAECQLLLFTPL